MAKRIQRKRSKGWRMPENAVYVGRPSKWGNPYKAQNGFEYPPRLVELYREWIEARDEDAARSGRTHGYGPTSESIQRELRGKDLACWCPLDQPCHADVLLEVANAAPRRG